MKRTFTFLGLAALAFALPSCNVIFDCEEGEGDITSRTIMVEDFSEIALNGSMNVVVKNGKTQEVVVTGHPNIIEKLETDVRGSTWDVELEQGCYRDYKLKVEIVIPELSRASINGSGDIAIASFRDQSGTLELEIDGSGDISLGSFEGIKKLSLDINGSGDINVGRCSNLSQISASINGSGDIAFGHKLKAQHARYRIHGSGDIDAFNARTLDCDVSSNGTGDVECSVRGTLEANLNGTGNVYYKGDPILETHRNGTGRVQRYE